MATCKVCGKTLCLECAIEVGGGFACRNQCGGTVRAVIEGARRSERKTELVAGGAISVLLVAGALACFAMLAKDTLTTQTADLHGNGSIHVNPPVTMKVTEAEKIGYATGGVLLLAGGVCCLATTLRLRKL